MREEYRKIVNELLGSPGDAEIEFKSTTDTTVTGMMMCRRLDRIANALEGITQELGSMNVHLEDIDSIEARLEKLADCVGYAPPQPHQEKGYSFLRIAGQVDAN